jgi:hypothetical protein
MLSKIRCDICLTPIAQADPKKLSCPPKAKEFISLYPERQVPPPFPETLEWADFKCPLCRNRPFFEEHQVTTVNETGHPTTHDLRSGHVCDICGASYKHAQSLIRHKKEKHG